MNDRDLPPLDDDIRMLVDRARGIGAAPTEAKARVLAGVEYVVLPLGGGGHGQSGPGSTAVHRGGWARRVASGAIVFTLGGVAGVIATRAMVRPPAAVHELPPRIVYVERPAASVPLSEAEPTEPATLGPLPPDHRGQAPSTVRSSMSNLPSVRAGVSEERVLLDVARGALESEDWSKALAATKEHERRFPSGLLVQEREVMAVRALTMMGRPQEASARARRFRERFPDSFLSPALESFLGAGTATAP